VSRAAVQRGPVLEIAHSMLQVGTPLEQGRLVGFQQDLFGVDTALDTSGQGDRSFLVAAVEHKFICLLVCFKDPDRPHTVGPSM